jgi:hypothetical protein
LTIVVKIIIIARRPKYKKRLIYHIPKIIATFRG